MGANLICNVVATALVGGDHAVGIGDSQGNRFVATKLYHQ